MEIIFLNTSHLIFHTTNRLPEPTIASLQKLSMGTHEKIWNPQVLLRNEQQKDNVSCCFSVRRTLWFLCARLGTQVTFRNWKIWCNEIKFAHVWFCCTVLWQYLCNWKNVIVLTLRWSLQRLEHSLYWVIYC